MRCQMLQQEDEVRIGIFAAYSDIFVKKWKEKRNL